MYISQKALAFFFNCSIIGFMNYVTHFTNIKGGHHMDTVIEKISEIESAATSIMDNANERKKAFAKDMEERTAAFDAQLEAETNKKIEELRAGMEINMNHRLEKQRSDSQKLLRAMEKRYEDHHTQYAENLFNTMIKE